MFVRFDPFRDLDLAVGRNAGHDPNTIPMDAIRSENSVTIHFDLPGVSPDSVDLVVERRELRLNVTREFAPADDHEVVAHERPHGVFSRTLHLSETLDPSALDAKFHNGVLTVVIPVSETAQPRKVSIGAGGPALETSSRVSADSSPEA